jgi:hypothetical protein
MQCSRSFSFVHCIVFPFQTFFLRSSYFRNIHDVTIRLDTNAQKKSEIILIIIVFILRRQRNGEKYSESEIKNGNFTSEIFVFI